MVWPGTCERWHTGIENMGRVARDAGARCSADLSMISCGRVPGYMQNMEKVAEAILLRPDRADHFRTTSRALLTHPDPNTEMVCTIGSHAQARSPPCLWSRLAREGGVVATLQRRIGLLHIAEGPTNMPPTL